MMRMVLHFRGWLRRSFTPQRPTVSVVINTYNRRDSLKKTLDSLRRQRYRNFEVVVVNGPSTDSTDMMLKEYAGPVRLGSCSEACLGKSRNIGSSMAAGDIVAFTDDDAVPDPDWLERIVKGFNRPDIAAVGGAVFDVPMGRILWKICTCSRLGAPNTDSPPPADRYLGIGADPFIYLAGCNMSFRRSALQEIRGFHPLLTYYYDDVDICCRIVDAGYRILYLHDAVVRHDRAPNAVRDSGDRLRDPYFLVYSRAVFSLQCQHSCHSVDSTAELIQSWQHDYQSIADGQLAQGILSEEEHAYFALRVRQAIQDGTAAGHQARPYASLPDQPKADFLPFL